MIFLLFKKNTNINTLSQHKKMAGMLAEISGQSRHSALILSVITSVHHNEAVI